MVIDLKTEDGLNFLKEQRRSGKSRRETAENLGVSQNSIQWYLKRYHNTTWGKLTPRLRTGKAESIILKNGGLQKIIELKNQGYTQKDIQKEFGLKNYHSIPRFLSKYNVSWKDLGNTRISKGERHSGKIIDSYALLKEVCTLINEGHSPKEIEELLGIRWKIVKYHANRLGMPWNTNAIYENGYTFDDLYYGYNLSSSKIKEEEINDRQVLHNVIQRIQERNAQREQGVNFNIIENPEQLFNIEDVIYDYTNTDLTVREIRQKHGISQSQWKNLMKKFHKQGIPTRPRGRHTRKRRRIQLHEI